MQMQQKHIGPVSAERQRHRIEEEIAVLEQRLVQIGPDGDCGYENAMIRFFQQQIAIRRQRLGTPLGGRVAV